MAKLIVKLSKGLKEQFQGAVRDEGTTTDLVMQAMIRAYAVGIINIVDVEDGEIELDITKTLAGLVKQSV